eukprot:TRINITY_DN116_c0_g1_i1.p1 TRINITY_DN116_c0_g1~~TRINITY_DN116_c0_g1_i1.p1  ORF type:complete len:552 (-),score=190.12 TRINITY_DN116_c0_g1_i1:142-1797(-)
MTSKGGAQKGNGKRNVIDMADFAAGIPKAGNNANNYARKQGGGKRRNNNNNKGRISNAQLIRKLNLDLPKFDQEAHKGEINALSEKIDKKYEAINKINEDLKVKEQAFQDVRKQRDAVRDKVRASQKERSVSKVSNKNREVKRLELRNEIKKKQGLAALILKSLPISETKGKDAVQANEAFISKNEKDLQKQISRCQSAGEDKKLNTQLKKLLEKKVILSKYVEVINEVKKDKSRLKAFDEKSRKHQEKLKATVGSKDNLQNQIRVLSAKVDEAFQELAPLREQRNTIRDEISKIKKERDAAYKTLRAKRNEHHKKVDAILEEAREKEKELRKKEQEQQAKEREAARLKALAIPPFLDDIKCCNNLIKYLNKLTPKQPKKADSDQDGSSDGDDKEVEEVKPANKKLKLSQRVYIQFEKLSLAPPVRSGDVSRAKEQVLARRAYVAGMANDKMIERGFPPSFTEDGRPIKKKKENTEKEGSDKSGEANASDKDDGSDDDAADAADAAVAAADADAGAEDADADADADATADKDDKKDDSADAEASEGDDSGT